jgi:hypothetical protein
MKFILTLSALYLTTCIFGQTTLFRFNFEGNTNPTIDCPTCSSSFSSNNPSTTNYFNGLNEACTAAESTQQALSKQGWDVTGRYYQFTVNTTNYQNLNLSACFRQSSGNNGGIFDVTVNGTSIGTVNFNSSSNLIVPFNSGTFTQGQNSSNVVIQFINTTAAGASTTAIRIDNVILTADISLPVKYSQFYGTSKDGNNLLTWATSSEVNNSHFEIERSADGETFEPIGRVDAKGGSRSDVNYEFVDHSPFMKANYYRLKQVDLDGQFSFSDIVFIHKVSEDSELALYNGRSFRSLVQDQNLSVKIFNTNGQEVTSFILHADHEVEVELQPYNVYIAKIYNDFGNTQVVKFNK